MAGQPGATDDPEAPDLQPDLQLRCHATSAAGVPAGLRSKQFWMRSQSKATLTSQEQHVASVEGREANNKDLYV